MKKLCDCCKYEKLKGDVEFCLDCTIMNNENNYEESKSTDKNNIEIMGIIKSDHTTEQCKGLVYRANVQHCRTKQGILFSVRLNKLKKKSCFGCEECECIEDQLSEISYDWPLINIETVEHGKLYTIGFTNISRDWETGVVDEWDLEVIPYKE